jgi:hypothetical protein
MSIRDEIKGKIVQAGWSMSDVVKVLNEKQGRLDTVQNLSNKLTRETLRYKDAQEIAQIIGYTIVWEPIGK